MKTKLRNKSSSKIFWRTEIIWHLARCRQFRTARVLISVTITTNSWVPKSRVLLPCLKVVGDLAVITIQTSWLAQQGRRVAQSEVPLVNSLLAADTSKVGYQQLLTLVVTQLKQSSQLRSRYTHSMFANSRWIQKYQTQTCPTFWKMRILPSNQGVQLFLVDSTMVRKDLAASEGSNERVEWISCSRRRSLFSIEATRRMKVELARIYTARMPWGQNLE